MTLIPINDAQLISDVAKACMRSPSVPTATDLSFVANKLLPELQAKGFSIVVTPRTAQDHMRKYDSDSMTKYTDHGIQDLAYAATREQAENLQKQKEKVPHTADVFVFGFGTALDALILHGKKLARVGWNGKDMFVYFVPANSYPSVTDIAQRTFGEYTRYNSYFAIKNVDGTVSTWVPSVNDLVQKDWYIVK